MIHITSSLEACLVDAGQGDIEHERRKMLFNGLLAHRKVVQEIANSRLSKLPILKFNKTGNLQRDAEKAKVLLNELPSDHVLHGWRKELEQALSATKDDGVIKLLLSMMFGGFRNHGGISYDGYFQSLDLAYGDKLLSLDLMAYTITRIVSLRQFPPTVSEFIAEYEAVRLVTEQVAARVERALQLRAKAVAVQQAVAVHRAETEAEFMGKEVSETEIFSQCKMKGC